MLSLAMPGQKVFLRVQPGGRPGTQSPAQSLDGSKLCRPFLPILFCQFIAAVWIIMTGPDVSRCLFGHTRGPGHLVVQ